MKKLHLIILTAFILMISGCSAMENKVEVLKGWTFQHNEETSDYSLFFGLCDKNENYISADATVDIRIESEDGEIVYEDTRNITEEDFDTYTSQVAGERYLANIRIKEADIAPGSSSSGTVYFTVTGGEKFGFEECNCSALYCLPVKDIKLSVDNLPLELHQVSYDGSIESEFMITDVQYSVDNSLASSSMKITILGEKTSGNSDNLSYDMFNYKIYDSEGYMVDSGSVFVGPSLGAGDKFKDDSLVIYDLTPGETYTLQLLDSEW